MTETHCLVCTNAARRRCTRCGQVFCDLHVRYGNPYFSAGSLGGGIGYYCDNCWTAYVNEGRRARMVAVALPLLALLGLLGFCALTLIAIRLGG